LHHTGKAVSAYPGHAFQSKQVDAVDIYSGEVCLADL
jgi:hypothetical protein